MSVRGLSESESTRVLVPEEEQTVNYGLKIVKSSVNILVHTLIGITVGVTVVFTLSYGLPPSLGMLHMTLCVVGYQLLMAQATLSLCPDNGWSSFLNARDKKRAHWILQILGSGLAIAGSAIEISQKSGHNFNTMHGKFGLVALVFTVISLLNGLTSLYAYELRKYIPQKLSKISHILFGTVAFVTASISLCFGFHSNFFRSWAFKELGEVMIVFTALLTFIVIVYPFFSLYKKIRK